MLCLMGFYGTKFVLNSWETTILDDNLWHHIVLIVSVVLILNL